MFANIFMHTWRVYIHSFFRRNWLQRSSLFGKGNKSMTQLIKVELNLYRPEDIISMQVLRNKHVWIIMISVGSRLWRLYLVGFQRYNPISPLAAWRTARYFLCVFWPEPQTHGRMNMDGISTCGLWNWLYWNSIVVLFRLVGWLIEGFHLPL